MAANTIDQADEPGTAVESHPIGCHALVPWVAAEAPQEDSDGESDEEARDPDAEDEDADDRDIHECTLTEDDETSLTTSLRLHLLSEHSVGDGLTLAEEDAVAAHRRDHEDNEHHHGIDDLRFRPARALAGMFLRLEREAALITPIAHQPLRD